MILMICKHGVFFELASTVIQLAFILMLYSSCHAILLVIRMHVVFQLVASTVIKLDQLLYFVPVVFD